MKKTIDISAVDSFSFVGMGDENIKAIQDLVNAKIVVRGSNMQLDGSKSDLDLVESVANHMMLIISNKGLIDVDEIKSYLFSLENGEISSVDIENSEPVVLYTHKGTVVARTTGQKKYLCSP